MNEIKPQTINLLEHARALKSYVVDIRRAIHARPELSFVEKETSYLVAEELRKLGCQAKTGIAGTGVVAEIGSGERLIGIRADMDALPIQETNQTEYCSGNAGIMHACGHDAHTACVLGAARLLQEEFSRSKPAGRVRFIFQPAEERVNEDGKSGAGLMIDAGVLDQVEALISLHVHPSLPAGKIGVRSGPLLAACDSFDATIIGKGSHAAEPEAGIDSIVLASFAIQALQQVISRRKSAVEPALITIGGIRSKTYAPNIVSESVEITGTVRYFNPAMHEILKEEISKALSVIVSLGGELHWQYRQENPPLINDYKTTELVRKTAVELLGKDAIIEVPLHMGAEDFSFYTRLIPSCFCLLGAGIENSPRKLHTSTFDINEDALPLGAALLAQAALRLLSLPLP